MMYFYWESFVEKICAFIRTEWISGWFEEVLKNMQFGFILNIECRMECFLNEKNLSNTFFNLQLR